MTQAGLCARCAHARVLRTRRGTTYLLCRRSHSDPSFARYPKLPVLSCPGYKENAAPGGEDVPLLRQAPVRAILQLAVPTTALMLAAACSNALQTYYVSRLGSDPIAAISLVFPVNMILVTLMAGAVGAGVSAAVARALGAGDPQAARSAAEHGLVLAAFGGFGLLVITEIIAATAFRAMGGRGEVLEQAVLFGRVLFAGLPVMFAGAALDAVMRGEGNMRTPALAGTFSMAFQAVAAPILMFGLGLGLVGAPLATLAGQVLALGVRSRHVFGGAGQVRPGLWPARIRSADLAAILKVGGPASAAGLTSYAGIVWLTGVFGRSGTAPLAAFGLGTRLDFIFVALAYGVGVAALTLVGMATGAGHHQLARRYVMRAIALIGSVVGPAAVLLAVWPAVWLRLFTHDAEILAAGTAYVRLVSPSYIFVAVTMVLGSAFQGMGRASVPLAVVAGRTCLVVTTVTIAVGSLGHDVRVGFAAVSGGNILAAIVLSALFARATARHRRSP